MTDPLVELSSIVKHYHGLRPLRIAHFTLEPRDRYTLLGLDHAASEVLIGLLTGAVLPDQGTVTLFGRRTADITDSREWLSIIDRIGLVSPRAALFEALTVAQNLAMPLSLDVDPLSDALRDQAIASGREVGLSDGCWDRPVSAMGLADRLRVKVARALALGPEIVLIEHPTVDLPRADVAPCASDIAAVLSRREAAALVITADRHFAAVRSTRVLELDPATGRLADH